MHRTRVLKSRPATRHALVLKFAHPAYREAVALGALCKDEAAERCLDRPVRRRASFIRLCKEELEAKIEVPVASRILYFSLLMARPTPPPAAVVQDVRTTPVIGITRRSPRRTSPSFRLSLRQKRERAPYSISMTPRPLVQLSTQPRLRPQLPPARPRSVGTDLREAL